jgi:phosphatidylglycerophosphatase C
VNAAASAPRRVAAFDFDGTLTRFDSLLPFLARVAGTIPLTRALALEAPTFVAAALGRVSRDVAKARLLRRTLAGRETAAVEGAGRAYAAHLVSGRMRAELADRIAWHRNQGHELVLVSASLDVYLDEVGRLLDFDAVLCTRLERGDDGRLTGELHGQNCRGSEKLQRVRAYLDGGEDAAVELWAYGDSHGDRELLALADHAVRVRARVRRVVLPPA